MKENYKYSYQNTYIRTLAYSYDPFLLQQDEARQLHIYTYIPSCGWIKEANCDV